MSEFPLDQRSGKDSLSTAILSEVAALEGVDPIDISPPFYTAIDPDALEKLFSGGTGGFTSVEFTYADHRISIQRDDVIRIDVE